MIFSICSLAGDAFGLSKIWDTGYHTRFHFLGPIVCGIAMCIILYQLTGFVSVDCFSAYNKLKPSLKVEWNNRGFSTFHAIFAASASFYLLVLSGLFDEEASTDLITNRSSPLSSTILGISVGYFLTDLAMILRCYPALGGVEYLLHHGLSLYSISLALISGQAQFYILMVLFTEITTPFVNLRWYLDVAGQKSSMLYVYNGVALFLGWLVARIILFVYFFYHIFIHFEQVKQIFPLGFYSLISMPSIVAILNIFWFWKILKGMVKTLSKARRRD